METPEWADQELSKELAVLRARGENQDLEYIRSFPENVRELGKEIAAFATSNTGRILLGVSDAGELVGLPNASTPQGRDQLLRRIEGICRGTIKPAITPIAKFAVEADAVVLVLTVPKGNQPIYYCHNRPYVRHITESRPAEPHEIVELFREYRASPFRNLHDSDSDARNAMFSELARIVTTVLVFADQAEERSVNPWLDKWIAEFRYAASELRELAASDAAVQESASEELYELADALDRVGAFRMYAGSWPEFKRLTQEAAAIARDLKRKRIDPLPLGPGTKTSIRDMILTSARRLAKLVSRADAIIESGRIEELQSEASDIGRSLLQATYYRLDFLGQKLPEELQSVARELHLVETARIYSDGGLSLHALRDKISECSSRLNDLSGQLST